VLALRSFNDTVMRENELFESHLQRTNPHLLSDDDEAGKGRKTKQTKRSQQMLTPEQKYDIAVQEMEEVREEIGGTKQNAEQLMDTLRARMEECDVRIAEIKKDAYEFKRDIVTGALPASMRMRPHDLRAPAAALARAAATAMHNAVRQHPTVRVCCGHPLPRRRQARRTFGRAKSWRRRRCGTWRTSCVRRPQSRRSCG
jgi:hypothetical protein